MRVIPADQARDAEIEQLRRAVARHQHVARLQVRVDDELLVRELHRAAHRGEQREALAQARLLGGPIRQRHAGNVLHHDVRGAAWVDTAVEQPCDVRVLQAREDSSLGGELRERARGQDARANELDRDGLLEEAVVALAAVDGAHAADADQLGEAIGSDALGAAPVRGRLARDHARGIAVGSEHAFHRAP